MENSRRPSEENIYLTPPWMEDEQQSCGVGARNGNDNIFVHCHWTCTGMFLNVDREELKETSIAPCGGRGYIFLAPSSCSDSQPLQSAKGYRPVVI